MISDELVASFVASFQYDQLFTHADPPPVELNAGMDPCNWDCVLWQPAQIETSREELKGLYADLAAKFPPLFEQLVLSWSWLDVDIPVLQAF